MVALDALLSAHPPPHQPPTQSPNQKTTICALIDNKALINRIQQWTDTPGLAATLAPEHDLLQAAQKIAKKHSIHINPSHVKSHQDETVDYDLLPWQARLNCDCDRLADAVRGCTTCAPLAQLPYSLPPGHGATLIIQGTYVTAHMASAIREASYYKELRQYIETRAGWPSTATFDSIDWSARDRAAHHLSETAHLTTFKMEHDLLATMHRRNKFERDIDHRCPRCHQFHEDFTHVLKCPKAQQAGHTMWQTAISFITVRRTCPFLILHLSKGIQSWLAGTPTSWDDPTPPATDSTGSLVHAAFQAQGIIGWDQALRGRISNTWGLANAVYCRERFQIPTNDPQNLSWTDRVITAMWQYGRSRWIERNEAVYGKTKEEQLQKKTTEIDQRIRSMHRNDQTRVQFCDHHLFTMPVEQRLMQEYHQKRLWVETVEIAYRAWEASNADNAINTQAPRPVAPIWGTSHGRRPRVRLRE